MCQWKPLPKMAINYNFLTLPWHYNLFYAYFWCNLCIYRHKVFIGNDLNNWLKNVTWVGNIYFYCCKQLILKSFTRINVFMFIIRNFLIGIGGIPIFLKQWFTCVCKLHVVLQHGIVAICQYRCYKIIWVSFWNLYRGNEIDLSFFFSFWKSNFIYTYFWCNLCIRKHKAFIGSRYFAKFFNCDFWLLMSNVIFLGFFVR